MFQPGSASSSQAHSQLEPDLECGHGGARLCRKRGVLNQWRLEAAGSVEKAQRYLAANYSCEECETTARRLHNSERKRDITICGDCCTHVGEDHVLLAPVGEMRMCDFVVDPI